MRARRGEVVGVVKSVPPYGEVVVGVVRLCQIGAATLGEEVVIVIAAATIKSRRGEEVVRVVRTFSILPMNEGIKRPAPTAPACEVAPR
jgi:hypothetical protein